MLKRVHVRGFKSLHDVKVDLAPLVVILGPNAAGKSNFLEALGFLARLGTERTLDDAFKSPFRGYPAEAFTLPETGLTGLLSQASADLSIEADVVTVESHPLRYRLGVRIVPETGALSVTDEYLTRLNKGGQPKEKARIEKSPTDGGEGNGERLAVRHLGEAGRALFQPIGLNHSVLSNLQFSGERRFPDFDRLRDEFRSWRTYYLDPRVEMRNPQPPREVGDIGARGESIAPFLHRLKNTEEGRLPFEGILRVLRGAIPSVQSVDVELDEKRGSLDIQIVQDGTTYSSRVVSEGTLRVLALCALAANPWPSSLLAFEEPENGVHPGRIVRIAQLLSSLAKRPGRQVVVTTHSPELVLAILRLVRNSEIPEEQLKVLRCGLHGRETVLVPLALSGELYESVEIGEALRSKDDIVEAMMVRGWLDG